LTSPENRSLNVAWLAVEVNNESVKNAEKNFSNRAAFEAVLDIVRRHVILNSLSTR